MKKVMVVDDSLSLGRQLSGIISNSGDFEVVGHAKDGAEAIQMYLRVHPDIVCMDLNMPIMDGLTALRTLMMIDKQK